MAKLREISLPFPFKGLDKSGAYERQPPGTTAVSYNVRPYDVLEDRARGGQRPGLNLAYAQQLGGGEYPVQWLGYFDYGFGVTRIYQDEFDYTDGVLSGNAAWAGETGSLVVKDGYVHVDDGDGVGTGDSGPYGNANLPANFQDFELISRLGFEYATNATIEFFFKAAGGGADTGAITVTSSCTELTFPLFGFTQTVRVALSGFGTGSAVAVSNAAVTWTREAGLRVVAGRNKVTVYWNEQAILTSAKTDVTFQRAGFRITTTNGSGSGWIPNAYIDGRVYDWNLITTRRATTITRQLVSICNHKLYRESAEGTMSGTAVTNVGTAYAGTTALYSAAWCNGELFFLDGAQPRVYDPNTPDVDDWAAFRGKIEKNARGIVNWRNRIVLFDTADDPFNYFMSRQGDAYDFEYGQDDAQSAVAGNLSDNGRIP